MRSQGDEVVIRSSVPTVLSGGELNSYFLAEQGVRFDTKVPIVEITGRGRYVVKLPLGYRLHITERDIVD